MLGSAWVGVRETVCKEMLLYYGEEHVGWTLDFMGAPGGLELQEGLQEKMVLELAREEWRRVVRTKQRKPSNQPTNQTEHCQGRGKVYIEPCMLKTCVCVCVCEYVCVRVCVSV